METYNTVQIPLYEINDKGEILPNPIFHRSFDYLHSRCIEYPFAASQVQNVQSILDIGSVKADLVWINWLDNLPLDVHAVDYDNDDLGLFKKAKFSQTDARNLPFPDEHFDLVLAVSVIEHIGLLSPQVSHDVLPTPDTDGDIAAFIEFLRVLKPGGRLVVTFPYSNSPQLRRKAARVYDEIRLQIFNTLAQPEVLDYYEYQYVNKERLFVHKDKQSQSFRANLLQNVKRLMPNKPSKETKTKVKKFSHGKVTWRRIERSQGQASNHQGHIDGIICGVWTKREAEQK